MALPLCDLPLNADGSVDLDRLPDLKDCRIPDTVKTVRLPMELVQEPEEGPEEPVPAAVVAETPTRPHPRAKEHVMADPVHPAPVAEEAPAPAQQLAASVGLPTEGLPDLKALMPKDGNLTGAHVAAMAVAVAGSGAVLKVVKDFLEKRSARQKEQDEEAKQAKAEQQEQKEEQHAQCHAAREALALRVSEAEAKAAAAQQEAQEAAQAAQERAEELSQALAEAQQSAAKALEQSAALAARMDASEKKAEKIAREAKKQAKKAAEPRK